MRFLCNLLIGAPIFGLIIGSLLLMLQALFIGDLDLGAWNVFGVLLDFMIRSVPGLEQAIRVDYVADLPMGAHLMILSAAGAVVMVPAGLILFRMRR